MAASTPRLVLAALLLAAAVCLCSPSPSLAEGKGSIYLGFKGGSYSPSGKLDDGGFESGGASEFSVGYFLRDRIAVETRRSYDLLRRAETARRVARLDLDVARERLSILLAKTEEGRASLGEVEEARFLEDQKWISFMDSRYAEERARLDLLQQTGGLIAALR